MTSMIAHPARGTESPSFKLENRVEVNPTTQGTQAPPKPARANITLPSRFAALPNLCDNKAIVIGGYLKFAPGVGNFSSFSKFFPVWLY